MILHLETTQRLSLWPTWAIISTLVFSCDTNVTTILTLTGILIGKIISDLSFPNIDFLKYKNDKHKKSRLELKILNFFHINMSLIYITKKDEFLSYSYNLLHSIYY